MKHKFSLIWRVAVALVLVLSFSLVAAVPAWASGTSMPDETADEIGITNATGTTLESIPATGTIYIWVHDEGADMWNKDPFSPESVTVTLTIKRGGVNTTVATKTYSAMEKGNDEEDFRTAAISVSDLGVEPGYRLIPSLTNADPVDSPYYIRAEMEFVEGGPYDIDGTMTLRVKDDSLNTASTSKQTASAATIATIGKSSTDIKASLKETGNDTGVFEYVVTPNTADPDIWCGDAMELIYKNTTTLGATSDQLKDTAYVYAYSPSSVSFSPGIIVPTASSIGVVVIDRDESSTSAADDDAISGALVVDSLAADDSVIDSLIVPDVLDEDSSVAGKFAVTVNFGTVTGKLDITGAAKLQATYTDPNDPDDVSTATATIGTPVSLYDDEGDLVNSYTTIAAALSAADTDYTIEVGPGTYKPVDPTPESDTTGELTINKEGLTLKSTGDATETIIEARVGNSGLILIAASDVTLDGFTIRGTSEGDTSPPGCIYMNVDGTTGVTIKNNIIEWAGTAAPSWSNAGIVNKDGFSVVATITNNTISGFYKNVALNPGFEATIGPNNTIEDAVDDGISIGSNAGVTITGNTIINNHEGVCIGGNDVTVSDNDISGNDTGIKIYQAATGLAITGNDITGNTDYGILIPNWDATNAIKFNNITGNTDYGIKNTSGGAVDATHNWWGATSSTDIAGMINDVTSSDVTTYDPWLGASVSVAKFVTSATSLDARTTVGVQVSGVVSEDIGAALYTANPKATFTALENGFFDVYVSDVGDATEVIIKFYVGDESSVVYAWNELEGEWVECSHQDYNSFQGFLFVKLHKIGATVPTVPTIEALAGLPFAISGEEVEEEDILDYYRGVDGIVSTSELLTAITDWAAGTIPSGFTEALTTTQLLALITEWAS